MLGHYYSNSSSPHQHQYQHSHHHGHQSMAAASPTATTFSLFFPLHNDSTAEHFLPPAEDTFDDDSHSSVTTSPSSPSSYSSTGSVDCTLSLGLPSSSRRATDCAAAETGKQRPPACLSSAAPCVSWDVAAAAAHQSYRCCCCFQGGGGGGGRPCPAAAVNKCGGGGGGGGHGQDPMLVDRRCANCGTSSTPLWRNGPRGPKTLCNACGIRFKKEERRAAAAAMEDQGRCGYIAQYEAAAAGGRAAAVTYGGGCEGGFPCGGGDVTDAEAVVPPQFLSWRLDVAAPPPAQQAAAFWPTTLFQYN